jgi:hypothetical protein
MQKLIWTTILLSTLEAMYPNKVQYRHSVLNEMFPAAENGGYSFRPVFDGGEPVISTGGNAIVFKVEDANGVAFALKFFTTDLEGRGNRLRAISEFLDNAEAGFFVPFRFVPGLIYVDVDGLSEDEKYFPGVVMRWIEGDTLDVKLKHFALSQNRNAILTLASKFRKIATMLLERGIAHGDLKLSNILVDDELELFLIDYDGMYLPNLKGQGAQEKGTSGYQHPQRSQLHFDESLDHFSILCIYSSLLIVAEQPDLFGKYCDGDNIIFTEKDFIDPEISELFVYLQQNGIQSQLLYYLRKSLMGVSINVQNLPDVLDGRYPSPTIDVNHMPALPRIGDMVKITWSCRESDFVAINDMEADLTGSMDLEITEEKLLTFTYGTMLGSKLLHYQINTAKSPRLSKLALSNEHLRCDESLVVRWKAENAAKVLLECSDTEVDVTNLRQYTFEPFLSDTKITFKLYAAGTSFVVQHAFNVGVFHPVTLRVKQSAKAIFPTRPVEISIESGNADRVIVRPDNIDVTGKTSILLRPEKSCEYRVIAENRRYSEEVKLVVDVLKMPSYREPLILLPRVQIALPPLFAPRFQSSQKQRRFAAFRSKLRSLRSFLRSMNIFTLDFKKTSW